MALQTTEFNELAGGVSDVVAHINSALSTLTYQPVGFLHVQEVTFSQYLALLTSANAFMAMTLREGMALRAHEVVECQEGRKRVLTLSQSPWLPIVLRCESVRYAWDSHGHLPGLYSIPSQYDADEEAASRWQELRNHVVTQIAQTFITSFLTWCLRAHVEHMSLSIDPLLIPSLDLPRLTSKYRHLTTSLVFVDLERRLWVRNMSKSAMIEWEGSHGRAS